MSFLGELSRLFSPLVVRTVGRPCGFLGRAAVAIRTRSQSTVIAASAFGLEETNVLARVRGELIERVSAYTSGVDHALATHPVGALPFSLPDAVPFARWQYGVPSFYPDQTPRGEVRISTTPGVNLFTNEECHLPALLAFLRWKPAPGEPMFFPQSATGLAAAMSIHDAATSAVLEVVERDAIMLRWRTGRPGLRYARPSLLDEGLVAHTNSLGLQTHCLIFQDTIAPVCLTTISLPDGTRLASGSACALSVSMAVKKAQTEALMAWHHFNLEAPDPKHANLVSPRTSAAHLARAYWRGPEVLRRFAFGEATDESETVDVSWHDVLRGIQSLRRGGAFACTFANSLTRDAGLVVCRAIVPGLHPKETDHRAAYLGGPRLAAALNSSVEILDVGPPSELNLDPHPFG